MTVWILAAASGLRPTASADLPPMMPMPMPGPIAPSPMAIAMPRSFTDCGSKSAVDTASVRVSIEIRGKRERKKLGVGGGRIMITVRHRCHLDECDGQKREDERLNESHEHF